MTPDAWLARMLETVDELAFRLAHTPRDYQAAWLQRFSRRVRKQWCVVFPFMSAEDVSGMVDDLLSRVRKRRDEIEAAGAGTA
jgi:hypothetical protein